MNDTAQDSAMAFFSERQHYDGSRGLHFDQRYRTAQLPLVDSDHPMSLNVDPDGRYKNGHRMASQSIVIPIAGNVLAESECMREVICQISKSRIGNKICWETEESRRGILHATICGLHPYSSYDPFPFIYRREIEDIPAFNFELKGLFIGKFNTGRIYICLYPDLHGGVPATDRITQALDLPANRVLLCGFLNLKDELTSVEAFELSEICDASSEIVFDTQACSEIRILESFDDLVLDSRIIDRLELRDC